MAKQDSGDKVDAAFADLGSKDVALRRKAASTIARDAMRVVNRSTQEWSRDLTKLDRLLRAVDDPDPKVSEQSGMALGRLVEAYYGPEQRERERLETPLRRQLGHPSFPARRWAVEGLWALVGIEAEQDLLPLLMEDKSPVVRHAVLRGLVTASLNRPLPAETKARWRGPVMAALGDKAPEVRHVVVGAIGAVGDKSSIPAVEKVLATTEDPILIETLQLVAQQLRGG